MDQAMDDRRRSKRLKSFLQGLVYIDKRRGAMNCVIRDLSDMGARMILSETVAIPDIVSLHIPQKDETYRARVKWRHGDEIGLAFEAADSESEHADAGDLAKRVSQLEIEIALLRRMVKRLKAEKQGDDGEVAA
jgi:hypothetical protein